MKESSDLDFVHVSLCINNVYLKRYLQKCYKQFWQI